MRTGTAAGKLPAALMLLTVWNGGLMADNGYSLHELPMDRWRLVTDGVMGGVSRGDLQTAKSGGLPCVALRGQVSTANNGGFVQMALDLSADEPDPRSFSGLHLLVRGNGEQYNVHLRTRKLFLPWQSYRVTFTAPPEWTELLLPFSEFRPYRTRTPLDNASLTRIGVVAIGRDFDADLCLASLGYYRLTR